MNGMNTDGENSTTLAGGKGLRIIGRVRVPLFLEMEFLRSLDTATTESMPMICGSGEVKGRIGACRGVLLADIINRADVVVTGHNDTKKIYVVASSDDGYKAVFSWQEIFNSPNGEGIFVVLEKDEKSLGEGGCERIDLFSSRDHLSGPRYVKSLKVIEVAMVE